ncbi:hypothetical protein BRADI_4g07803v3 [Brachypodium distachyon]|uniref:Uncharacterized protein n=1 Tax=Brachypodium distachyon TaxID=15368 RepID=A0A0Q3PCB7_BRADI|nr:hypothetical protein BRADI_4g07803v3 [Brachypodium distachyon]
MDHSTHQLHRAGYKPDENLGWRQLPSQKRSPSYSRTGSGPNNKLSRQRLPDPSTSIPNQHQPSPKSFPRIELSPTQLMSRLPSKSIAATTSQQSPSDGFVATTSLPGRIHGQGFNPKTQLQRTGDQILTLFHNSTGKRHHLG